jgi:glycosyltransferase involved in cell wall biosynthesis
MTKDTRLAIAMISRNEEGAVAGVMNEIRAVLGDVTVVLVDSSTDRTADIATELGATVVRQVPPKGYGPAMMLALKTAAEHSLVVLTLDCDGTYPVAAIPQIASMIVDGGFDLVNASRLKQRPKAMPVANWLANTTFAVTTRVLFGLPVTDVHSGMRGYRSSMLREVDFDAQGPALPVELLIKPACLGFKVTEIGIDYRERVGQTTLNRFESTVWTFKRMFRLVGLSPRAKT